MEIPITAAQMPADPRERKTGEPEKKEWFGLGVRDVTPEIAKQLGLAKAEGVVIERVGAGSPAQEVGLRPGDVILEINRQKISSEEDYRKAMEKVVPEKGALLLVKRGGSTFFVSLKESK